jgi:hypothetical protein
MIVSHWPTTIGSISHFVTVHLFTFIIVGELGWRRNSTMHTGYDNLLVEGELPLGIV